MTTPQFAASRAGSGISGLDDILAGGWPADRLYLVQGPPGSGKTTLGLQFLREGAARGEPVLYVTLSESRDEVEEVARSHGWSLDGIEVLEPAVLTDELIDEENTVFHPSEIELRETVAGLLREIERVKPRRVVFDSLSELRLLAQSPLQYRRQILRLKRFFAGQQITLLLLDDGSGPEGDMHLQSIAHGVLSLEQLPQGFGGERRRLRISKLRGLKFRGGHHDYRIETGGIVVFPRLVAAEHRADKVPGRASTGNPQLDSLLGGGLDRGTSTLLIGPAGSGKSSVALQMAIAAAQRGENVAMYAFDEGKGTLLARAHALGLPLERELESGRIRFRQIDAAEIVPDELVHLVRQAVEQDKPSLVMIDSLNGYLQSMPHERHLTLQLHELLSYLSVKGVITVLALAQSGLVGSQMSSPIDISYIADTVLLFRYFEASGRVRKAISAVKKRSGAHEDTIRELTMGSRGIRVGEPLTSFRGVLTGIPSFEGNQAELGDPE